MPNSNLVTSSTSGLLLKSLFAASALLLSACSGSGSDETATSAPAPSSVPTPSPGLTPPPPAQPPANPPTTPPPANPPATPSPALPTAVKDFSYGTELPPAGSMLGASFGIWQPNAAYPDDCPKEEHDKFWARGPDGKIYPTWHPPVWTNPATNKTCHFAHEHGDDPRQGPWPAELVPFGYVNEVYNAVNPTGVRHEDHVGHKVHSQKEIKVYLGNDPQKALLATCKAQIKLHQGTHSPDALTNNLHELFYRALCSHGIEVDFKILAKFGTPGEFTSNFPCGIKPYPNVGPATPTTSPAGDGTRQFADKDCAEKAVLVAENQQSNYGPVNDEFWNIRYGNKSFGQLKQLHFNPYFFVSNPSRYFDPTKSNKIARTIDLCYVSGTEKARGDICEKMRNFSVGGMAFDDTRSYWKGTIRNFNPNRLIVRNEGGPTVLYTDALGDKFSDQPFQNSIKQFVKGNHEEIGGDLFMESRDFNAPGVRAVN